MGNKNESKTSANNAHFKTDEFAIVPTGISDLIESADVAILLLDKNLKIRKFTSQIEPVFKLTNQDLGKSLENFAHHFDRPGLVADLIEVSETGVPIEDEVRDREGRWLAMRLLPFRSKKRSDDRSKQPNEGVVLTLVDIDTLKKTQASLESDVKNRERFLAMISHEMRNPISAVLSASHLLKSDKADEKLIENAVSVIQRQSDHVSRLLDDLLDVSRLTQNKLQLKKRNINFRNVVQQAIETMKPEIDRRSQILDLDMERIQIPINGDPARLHQVVGNLLGNASKYSPEGSTIGVEVRLTDSEIILSISDQGDGITAEMQAHIFKPFAQLPRTKDQREGGMGVGLSLVKFIADKHGGNVSGESGVVGTGSKFVLKLPLISSSRVLENERPVTESTTNGNAVVDLVIPQPHRTQRNEIQKIVVVEHQKDNREMLEALLEMEGFEIVTAKNAESGLQQALDSKPDAVLIDVGLPGDDGYSLALEIRQDLGNKILLVALTGQGKSYETEASEKASFDEQLVKPIDLDQLLKILKSNPTVKKIDSANADH
jgi:two-component system CheB/CheR fusion protein